jgi:signal transduction histidine kinase
MISKKICEQLNVKKQCRKYGLPLWQCPQFLFLVMGVLIMIIIVVSYLISIQMIDDPRTAILIILVSTFILVVIDYIIVHSFEKLAESTRMKMEFIGIVSHQLRSPVTNLKYALESLMSGELGEIQKEQLDYLTILKQNADRLQELIDDILVVSRIQTGVLSLKKEDFSIADLVEKTIAENKPLSLASNITINFKKGENVPDIISDSFWIKEAFKNLLDNAIRYQKGKGNVDILLEKRNKNIYLEVKDSGVGIPKADQKYIFQKFFRAKNVLKGQTSGTGLGLFIVKGVIEKLGGKINFISKENKGSTFWFSLPIKLIKIKQ